MPAVKFTATAALCLLLVTLFLSTTTIAAALTLPGVTGTTSASNNGETATSGAPVPSCVPSSSSPAKIAGMSTEQMANAATIIAAGKQRNVPEQGWIVAIAAALTESGLLNVNHGDRDSLGLFQQRPSQGWGTPAQVMNPTYAATRFYQHLLAVPGWQQMTVTAAAQAVQRSALPNAYAAHEHPARAIVAATRSLTCTPSQSPETHAATPRPAPSRAAPPATGPDSTAGRQGCGQVRAPTAAALAAINFACAQLGKPYVWGGNGTPGFDCSGLTHAAYAAAGIALPRTAQTQYQARTPLPAGTPPQPGDLLFFGTPSHVGHVAISLGGSTMIHAPTFGRPVQLADYRSQHHLLAVSRPSVTASAR